MLTVLDSNETASAEDAQQGMQQMNDMFALLAGDGTDLGWPPQANLSDEFPMDATVEAQAKSLLAMHLHAFYPSVQLPQVVPIQAARALNQIRRVSVLQNMEEASMSNVPLGEANYGVHNILTGE
jgi:hypothetical protein